MSNLIPRTSSLYNRTKHKENEEEWKNFAGRITKNPFVFEYLLKRDNNTCQWCKKPLSDKGVIHHIDYDHKCVSSDFIRVPHPTEKRPNKTRMTPDCQNCKKEAFDICMSKVTLVHNACNWVISKISPSVK